MRLGRNLPGKLRAGRVIRGVHYRRARFRPFRRAVLTTVGSPRAIAERVAFGVNPEQERR